MLNKLNAFLKMSSVSATIATILYGIGVSLLLGACQDEASTSASPSEAVPAVTQSSPEPSESEYAWVPGELVRAFFVKSDALFAQLLQISPSAVNLVLPGKDVTPLMAAVMVNDIDAVQKLLAAGADPDVENSRGDNAWMKVCGNPQASADMVAMIKANVDNPDLRNASGQSASDIAILAGRGSECVDLSWFDGTDQAQAKLLSLLMTAIEAENFTLLRELLSSDGSGPLSQPVASGFTLSSVRNSPKFRGELLGAAARNQSTQSLIYLIQFFGSGSSFDGSGLTPLQNAVLANNLNAVSLLVKAGVDLDTSAAGNTGITPMSMARLSNNPEMMSLLGPDAYLHISSVAEGLGATTSAALCGEGFRCKSVSYLTGPECRLQGRSLCAPGAPNSTWSAPQACSDEDLSPTLEGVARRFSCEPVAATTTYSFTINGARDFEGADDATAYCSSRGMSCVGVEWLVSPRCNTGLANEGYCSLEEPSGQWFLSACYDGREGPNGVISGAHFKDATFNDSARKIRCSKTNVR